MKRIGRKRVMSEALVPYFVSGGGFAGLVVVAFILGLLHPKSAIDAKDREIAKLERALELERARSDAGVLAASVVRDVMEALRSEASTK